MSSQHLPANIREKQSNPRSYPVESITVKDFRCFHEEQTARLAPLTLLVGENSTGKTSFMAMIRALTDLAFPEFVPGFKEDPYDLGSIEEIIYKPISGNRSNTFEGGFYFTPQDKKGKPIKSKLYRFNSVFGKSEKGTSPVPISRRISDCNSDTWVEYRVQKKGNYIGHFNTPDREWKIKFKYRHRDDMVLPFYLPLVSVLENGNGKKSDLDMVRGVALPSEQDWNKIEDICMSLGYMDARPYAGGPVRSRPRRYYEPSHDIPDPEGYHIPMVLNNLYYRDDKAWSDIKIAIEKFGKESGLFDEITINSPEKVESGTFQIQIRRFWNRGRKGPRHNLIDVGYGVSQALPVITELFLRGERSVFLLQQPEVHLHPSAQAALGSQFCDMAASGRQLIVETHSDHLLDRVRMDIRDSKTDLLPEDVSILYFERGDQDVLIHTLGIDKDGNVLNAPSGYRQFFLDEADRSYGLI